MDSAKCDYSTYAYQYKTLYHRKLGNEDIDILGGPKHWTTTLHPTEEKSGWGKFHGNKTYFNYVTHTDAVKLEDGNENECHDLYDNLYVDVDKNVKKYTETNPEIGIGARSLRLGWLRRGSENKFTFGFSTNTDRAKDYKYHQKCSRNQKQQTARWACGLNGGVPFRSEPESMQWKQMHVYPFG